MLLQINNTYSGHKESFVNFQQNSPQLDNFHIFRTAALLEFKNHFNIGIECKQLWSCEKFTKDILVSQLCFGRKMDKQISLRLGLGLFSYQEKSPAIFSYM